MAHCRRREHHVAARPTEQNPRRTLGGSGDAGRFNGTQTAGVIGALNNGIGMAGVAPGTVLWAVKIGEGRETFPTGDVLCGLNWVIQRGPALGIRVANMSYGGDGPTKTGCGPSDPEHEAVCRLASVGVVPVAAADNTPRDINDTSPAGYPEVLAVTSMTDSDGNPGSKGSLCDEQPDDIYTGSSGYAVSAGDRSRTVAAPGECVFTTTRGLFLADPAHIEVSGTSVAAPAVSGAVAACFAEAGVAGPCAGMSVPQVIRHIADEAEAFGRANFDIGVHVGFAGDPTRPPADQRHYGYLSNVASRRVTRVGGDERVGTAIRLSLASFPDGSTKHAVVANYDGNSWRDAIAGSGLAGAKEGPLLLQPPFCTDEAVNSELRRLFGGTDGTIWVVGGPAGVDPCFDAARNAEGFRVVRLAGADTCETAVAIADEVIRARPDVAEIGLVTADSFSDGVSMSAVGAGHPMPILLTPFDNVLCGPIAAFLVRQLAIRKAHIAGGVAAVSDGAEAQVRAIVCPRNALEPDCTHRHAGENRYETSSVIARAHFGEATNFVAATGADWPDSIAGGPFAARRAAPILLTETFNFNRFPATYMAERVRAGNQGWVVGGPTAVHVTAEWEFRALLPK